MFENIFRKPLNGCHNKADAGLQYKITTSCSDKIRICDIACKSAGVLSLVPGSVTDDSGLACCGTAAEIILPACKTYIIEQEAVQIEAPCQTICDGCGICAADCIWTSTSKQASVSFARAGDSITYTVTFTNHSSVPLDMVCIFDTLPAGVTLIPGTIHPSPQPGETLQTGVSAGSLAAGQTAILTYSVIVNCAAAGDIVNHAYVRYCYTDCRNCRKHGVSGCKCTIVKFIADNIKIAVSKAANKNSVCYPCEEIRYTLKISNPSKVTLTDVVVCDDLPQGLCYKANSTTINGGYATDANPQNGICIGDLYPDETCTVTFILCVCPYTCRGHIPCRFVNIACARGNTGSATVSAESNPWTIIRSSNCRYQCIQRRFSICGFGHLKSCHTYHTGAFYFDTGLMKIVIAGFGINVKYIDCHGKKKSKYFKGHIVFHNLTNDFNPHNFTVCFTNLFYDADCEGNLTTEFEAVLRYCEIR